MIGSDTMVSIFVVHEISSESVAEMLELSNLRRIQIAYYTFPIPY